MCSTYCALHPIVCTMTMPVLFRYENFFLKKTSSFLTLIFLKFFFVICKFFNGPGLVSFFKFLFSLFFKKMIFLFLDFFLFLILLLWFIFLLFLFLPFHFYFYLCNFSPRQLWATIDLRHEKVKVTNILLLMKLWEFLRPETKLSKIVLSKKLNHLHESPPLWKEATPTWSWYALQEDINFVQKI